MTPAEILARARSHNIKIELNAANDGLAGHGNPPADLLERLTASKPEIVAHLLERRRLLQEVEAAKPADAPPDRWAAAVRGLRVFLNAGHADAAEAVGWSKDELYAIPPRWARIELCGAALLVGDKVVESVTADAITVVTSSGAQQVFRRAPKPDFALAYRARLRELARNFARGEDDDEARARAFDHAVDVGVDAGLSLEAAKAAVLDAIKGKAP